jgi:hypothetical protein
MCHNPVKAASLRALRAGGSGSPWFLTGNVGSTVASGHASSGVGLLFVTPVRTYVLVVLQPSAAASLIASSEFASGSTFRRQVAPCATAGQGGNRDDEGTSQKAPENRASSRPGWRKLSLRYMVIHGHLSVRIQKKSMSGSLVVGREASTSKPGELTIQAEKDCQAQANSREGVGHGGVGGRSLMVPCSLPGNSGFLPRCAVA